MKKRYKLAASVLTLSIVAGAACGCTKKSATDSSDTTGTSDSAVTEASVSEPAALVSEPAETTEFDIHDYSFDTIYGDQLPEYLNKQYYFNGEKVPIAESNFYFINAYLELSEYTAYGYYPATEDGFLDLTKNIEYGEGETGTYTTYSEFYTDYSERMLASTCIICKLAREQGLELSQETLDGIDGMLTELEEENAEPNGVTLDEYFQLYYGPECDTEAFRNVMIDYYLADLYTTTYMDNYEYTEEEIEQYTCPVIRYALFSAPLGASEEDLANAETMAQTLVDTAAGDIDDFYTLGQASAQEGACMQCSEISVPRGKTVSAFEDWAWDEARTEGELGVIYAEEYGYFAVGFVGMQLDEESASDIPVSALGDYVSSLLGTEGFVLSTDPDAA